MRTKSTNRSNLAALRRLDAALDRKQLEELAAHTDVLRVPNGEVLARAGHLSKQFIAVIDGYVDIATPAGHCSVAGPGTQLGADELLGGHSHAATISTRSESTLLVIFGPAYRWAMATSPGRSSPSASRSPEPPRPVAAQQRR
jgi:CRP-like cAMP-binding protein